MRLAASALAVALLSTSAAAEIDTGASARWRIESADGAGYATRGPQDDALLQRLRVHLIVQHDAWHTRVEIEDVRAFAKRVPAATDENRLDLRQVYLEYASPAAWLRIGRQELDVTPQRFLGVRDGPNLRQAFDGFSLKRAFGTLAMQVLISHPVDYRNDAAFDDLARAQRFDLVLLQRELGSGSIDAFYARLANDTDHDRRSSIDLRWHGDTPTWDWDVEAVLQRGRVDATPVRAWAAGLRGGYTQRSAGSMRWGLQLDLASGDARADDDRIGTFQPLFANGSYSFTLAGQTGYANLIQLKPSITLSLSERVRASVAVAGLWRQTSADAVYLQPDAALRGTAGLPGRRTARYRQLRVEWQPHRRVEWAAEFVHYDAGRAVRAAGGRDTHYAALDLSVSW
jgi:hypothetical protein